MRYTPLVIPPAQAQELHIELVEGGDVWKRREVVASHIADSVFDTSFLMSLARCAKVGVKQIVTAQSDKVMLFPSSTPGSASFSMVKRQFHRGSQIVVRQPRWNASKVLKCQHMPVKEAFLLLAGEGHDKDAPRVTQPHDEELHRPALAAKQHLGLTPVHLGILARFESQRDKAIRWVQGLLALRHIVAYALFTAAKPSS